MRKHLLRGLRVPGGYALLALAVAVSLFCNYLTLPAWADESTPPTVNLWVNANGYSSTLAIINTTGADIAVPRPCNVGPCITDLYRAHSVTRIPLNTSDGVGVFPRSFPPGIVTYTEIDTLLHTIARKAPLSPLPAAGAWLYDLPVDEHFESHVFVASIGGGAYSIEADDGTVTRGTLQPNDAHLVATPGRNVKVYPGWHVGVGPIPPAAEDLYAFAIVVHDATGAITVTEPIE